MEYGFTTMATPGLPVDSVIRLAREYGFDTVDLRVRDDGEIRENISYEEAESIKSKFNDIKLYTLFCYNETVKSGKDKMEASVQRYIEIAEMVNAENIRIFSGNIESGEELDMLCEVIESVLEKYKGKVNIFLQNHASNGLTCEQGIEVIKRVNDERLKFIFSPDECFKRGEEYLHLIPEITKITKQMFIADITESKKYCLIGDGIIPFKQIIGEMKACGFDGNLTLKWEKCWCEYLPSYQEGFRSFKCRIQNAE